MLDVLQPDGAGELDSAWINIQFLSGDSSSSETLVFCSAVADIHRHTAFFTNTNVFFCCLSSQWTGGDTSWG